MNENPISSARRIALGLRLLFGGLVITGVGISEAATGWLASGNGTRVFYLIACVLIGGLFVVAGTTELFGNPSTTDGEEVIVEEPIARKTHDG